MLNTMVDVFAVAASLCIMIFICALIYSHRWSTIFISAFIFIVCTVCVMSLKTKEINETQFLFIKNNYNKYGECKNILPQNKIIDIVTFEDYERCIKVEIKKEEEKKKIEKYNELLNEGN